MPIKISVENNFLKVEGNDPERMYYERSRVSHELLPTYVQLRYDNNKLAQLDLTTLDSTNTTFASLAAIVAFLTVAGDGDTSSGGSAGGGGGGLTQTQAQAAFTAALQAQAQTEFQDILLEDANGVVYISTRQVDEETGAVTFTSRLPDGTAHTPVAPITVPKIQTPFRTDFWANIAGTGYGIGDRLERVITGSTISWYNRTTETPIAVPALGNLVKNLEECFVRVTQTTSPNTQDLPPFATIFTDTPAISIPLIDGVKANTVYIYRSAIVTPSVAQPSETGTLLADNAGASADRTILVGYNNQREPQAKLTRGGLFFPLTPEMIGLVIRNYHLGSDTYVLKFSRQPNPEVVFNNGGMWLRIGQNTITTTSAVLNFGVTTKNIEVVIRQLTGATTPVTFALQKQVSGAYITISELTIAVGNTEGLFNANTALSRSLNFRLVPTGTFTSYSYSLIAT